MITNIRPGSVRRSRIYHVMSWYPFVASAVLGDIVYTTIYVWGGFRKGHLLSSQWCYKECETAWRLPQPPLGLASIGSQNSHIRRPKEFPVPHSLS